MKKLILLSIALLGSMTLFAQTNSSVRCDTIFYPRDVDVLPKFESEEFKYAIDYIYSKINFPEGSRIVGDTQISLIITKEGKVTDTKITKRLTKVMDDQVINALNNMPDWKPGKKDGKNVNTSMKMSVHFDI